MNKNKLLITKNICTLGMLIALGVVLSSILQVRLIGDIKVDLSYIVITVICVLYGGVIGGLSAGLLALIGSTLFSAYGISISWIACNAFIGLATGLVAKNVKGKLGMILTPITIVLSCSIGLLLIKTGIECYLYKIPLAVKIVKNAVAFGTDVTCMLIGYCIFVPRILKAINVNKTGNVDLKKED